MVRGPGLNPLRFGVWILTGRCKPGVYVLCSESQSPSIRGMDSDLAVRAALPESTGVSIPFDSGYGF